MTGRFTQALARAFIVGFFIAGTQAAPAPGDGAGTRAYDGSEPLYILRVEIFDREEDLPRLSALDLSLAGVDNKAGTMDFVGTYADYLRLVEAGFEPEVSLLDDPTAALSDYLDHDEITALLDGWAATYPAIAQKSQIATSVEGRPVWALKISDNVGVEEDEPVMFIVSQHHAREVMTPEIVTDLIDYLLTRYGTDPQVTHWIDRNEIWVVPSLNPDGNIHVFTVFNNWRKNRRDNGDGTFGVDPNRNYPFKWGSCNGSSSSGSSETYRGPSPASEPENVGWMNLADIHRPLINLSYHTYSELVLHPYGCSGLLTSENRVFRDLASNMASVVRNDDDDGWYEPGTALEVLNQTVDGEMNDWFYGRLGSYGITIEANKSSQGFRPDYATWRDTTVLRNRPGWMSLLDRLEGPGLTGTVTDACTGAPLEAITSLAEIVYVEGETDRTAEPLYGRFHWLTLPGTYTLQVDLAGYASQSWPVEVGFEPAARDVRLVPSGSFGADVVSLAIDDSASGDGDGQLDPGETAEITVEVTATGGDLTNLTATLSSAGPDVTVTQPNVTFGPVTGGATASSTGTQPAVTIGAGALDGEPVPLTLTFSADQTLCGPAVDVDARVTVGAPQCPAALEALDADPGWAIDNSGSSGWEFGQPSGGGGSGGPASGFTGTNVYATNLSGNYGSSNTYRLTSTAFDIASLRNVELRYRRWLNNEPGYDIARVEVSTDGAAWTEVWKGWAYDTDWEDHRLDVSAVVDGASEMYVRFVLETDVSSTQSGFYLDDVSACGETTAPSPVFEILSWSQSDAGAPGCSDGDAYGDAGELTDVTVTLKNAGARIARSTEAYVDASDNPNLGLVTVRDALGDVPVGGTAQATFRYGTAEAVACEEPATLGVAFRSDSGAFESPVGAIQVILEADDGTPVPDTFDDFETASAWTLGSEFEIGAPQGLGGTGTSGGRGGPDPTAAVSGTSVLGLDLSGIGLSNGNYESSQAGPQRIATSPVYDAANATGVDISFQRWLCVESNTADQARIEAFDGSSWNTVWSNPGQDLVDSQWQAVTYDVSPWADGNPNFQLRFVVEPNSFWNYCGWNVDDLTVGNGYTPRLCDAGSCAAGCAPSTEVTGVTLAPGPGDVLSWTPSADPCLETSGGPSYRVYRAGDPVPLTTPVNSWPDDTNFVDVSGLDGDGATTNPSFTVERTPPPGGVFYYLVVAMGTDGSEGPVGHYGQ